MTVPVVSLYEWLELRHKADVQRIVRSDNMEERRYREGAIAAFAEVMEYIRPDLIKTIQQATAATIAADIKRLATDDATAAELRRGLEFAAHAIAEVAGTEVKR